MNLHSREICKVLWSTLRVRRTAIKYLIAILLSAILITHMQAPIKKQVHHSVSAHVATVAIPASTPIKNVVPQSEKVVEAVMPTPQTKPTTYANGCNTYDSIFSQYDWNVSVAEAICEAESSGNPYALSQTHDYGLMQINHIHADMVDGDLTALYNPTENIAVAYRIYSAHGWTAWSTYLSGSYRRFL